MGRGTFALEVWPSDEVLAMAVCECTVVAGYTLPTMTRDGLNDDRMGPVTRHEQCRTCGGTWTTCPGHFGCIRLATPLYHVLFAPTVLKVLRRTCPGCGAARAESAKTCAACDHPVGKLTLRVDVVEEAYTYAQRAAWSDRLPLRATVDAAEARRRLRRLSDTDAHGLALCAGRPEHLLLEVLPVCPPQARPTVTQLNGRCAVDDLTHKYAAILKANDALRRHVQAQRPKHVVDEARRLLQWQVSTLLDAQIPSSHRQEFDYARQEARKGLRQRLEGKEGRFRKNLMGKRVDFSARTVITADPKLDVDQVGVPRTVALNLTVPVRVTRFNVRALKARLLRGADDPRGARYVQRGDGQRFDLGVCNRQDASTKLQAGDTVERPLQDDDLVVMNRQPSLHKMSMMAHRVKVLPGSTFRLNLSVTSPYNADFDGDEMNLHVPQDVASRVELEQLMSVTRNFISPQNNRPCMGIVQDSLLGSYLLTQRSTFLPRDVFLNALMHVEGWDGRIPPPAILHPTPLWTGKQLFSLTLPSVDYASRRREDADPWLTGGDDSVLIRDGALLTGSLTKKALGKAYNSLLHLVWKRHGADAMATAINAIQRVVDHWLTQHSFSTGISDCARTPAMANDIVPSALDDVAQLLVAQRRHAHHPLVESKVKRLLDAARDAAGERVLACLPRDHGMRCMAASGSKGSLINMCQIASCVGQQSVNGQRIGFTPSSHRTLPHFAQWDHGPASRGFVKHSYYEGLSPTEFFHHAQAGREGIIDTACKTATSGYTERKLVKCLENIKVEYDGTVRRADGAVLQFRYGDDGIDPTYSAFLRSADYALPPPWEDPTPSEAAEHAACAAARARLDALEDALLPVDLPTLEAAHRLEGGASATSEEARSRVEALLRRVDENALFVDALRLRYASTRVCREGWSVDRLEVVLDAVATAYDRHRVAPGEMVGVLAAQSISEPATQMYVGARGPLPWPALTVSCCPPLAGRSTRSVSLVLLLKRRLVRLRHLPQQPPQGPRQEEGVKCHQEEHRLTRRRVLLSTTVSLCGRGEQERDPRDSEAARAAALLEENEDAVHGPPRRGAARPRRPPPLLPGDRRRAAPPPRSALGRDGDRVLRPDARSPRRGGARALRRVPRALERLLRVALVSAGRAPGARPGGAAARGPCGGRRRSSALRARGGAARDDDRRPPARAVAGADRRQRRGRRRGGRRQDPRRRRARARVHPGRLRAGRSGRRVARRDARQLLGGDRCGGDGRQRLDPSDGQRLERPGRSGGLARHRSRARRAAAGGARRAVLRRRVHEPAPPERLGRRHDAPRRADADQPHGDAALSRGVDAVEGDVRARDEDARRRRGPWGHRSAAGRVGEPGLGTDVGHGDGHARTAARRGTAR